MRWLCVDDDEVWRRVITGALERRAYVGYTASSAEEALSLLERLRQDEAQLPSRVLCDLKMPGRDGLSLLPELRAALPQAVIIMLTGFGSVASAVSALKLGADHMMMKPASLEELTLAFEQLERERGLSVAESAGEAEALSEVPSLARVEWEHIQRVLAECDGNISQTAKVLGLHRRTLQRKLQTSPPQR